MMQDVMMRSQMNIKQGATYAQASKIKTIMK